MCKGILCTHGVVNTVIVAIYRSGVLTHIVKWELIKHVATIATGVCKQPATARSRVSLIEFIGRSGMLLSATVY